MDDAKNERAAKKARQEERDRIEQARKADEEAAAKRAADEEHREQVLAAIADAVCAVGLANFDDPNRAVAEALLAGKIPHVEVKL